MNVQYLRQSFVTCERKNFALYETFCSRWKLVPRNVDATTMRQINRNSVLQTIYQCDPISRIDISRRTGLTKGTVSSLVDELLADSFVLEQGYGSSSGGRKPILLTFNGKAGYAIGIDIQITHVKTVLADLRGDTVHTWVCRIPAHDPLSPDLLTDILREQIFSAAAAAPASPHGVLGVGIAFPGIVNFRTGTVFYLPNIGIQNWNVNDAFRDILPFPLFIDNDGNCGALAAVSRHNVRHLVYVNAGIGVGTGLVVNGRLHRGHNGIAGEFGHTTIAAIGLRCNCGNYGCWEQYASEQALRRYLRDEGIPEDQIGTGDDLVQQAVRRAEQGDEAARRALAAVGRYLGIGMSNVLNALNPELIVVGGTLAQAASHLEYELHTEIRHRAMAANKQTPIVFALPEIVAEGAARLVVNNTLLSHPLGT
jgi:N-acetylglucosamine repressor